MKNISKNKIKSSLKYHVPIVLFGIIMIYPLLWMLSASFKTNEEIFTGRNFLPVNPTLNNYISGLQGVSNYSFLWFFKNSFIISVLCIIGNILSCTLAAYAFSKLKFKLRSFFFAIVMVTMMLPFHVKVIPQYIVFNNLGWTNTFLPLVLPKFFATDGFMIFLLTQYMKNISNEMLEAPRIDGANTFSIFIYFIFPLSLPALTSVAIFSFIWSWNDFFSQMIYLSAPRKFTVSLALRMFVDATGQSSWGALFAMSVLSLIPIFLVFLVFQRTMLEGITAGSMKG